MEDKDLTQYLANVLAVARADGQLHPNEEAAIEQIRTDLKAKKTLLNRAHKLAAAEDFIAATVGRYSERMRNIEDMVFVAMVDGELAVEEKRIIVEFAKKAGCTQEQIYQIVSETKARVNNSRAEVECPSCKQRVQSTSKFCSACGAKLDGSKEATATKIEFDYPSQGISIEFCESSSASFQGAVSAARKAPNFQECQREKKTWFLATWPRVQIADAMNLVENLKGLRNRKVYLDGTVKPWDEAFGFIWCYQQRQQAFRPSQYCFGADDKRLNVWGCTQARMDWTSWSRWFSYGQFRKKDVFVFDKDKIRHELETNLFKVRFCPCLRPQFIEQVLALIPNEVRVSSGTGWKYNEDCEQVPNSIKIVEKQKEDVYTYTNEFYADGVRPVGPAVARDILTRAFKTCGITDVNLNELTG